MDHPNPNLTGAPTRPEWADLIDLASERLGGKALAASDDFFAAKENLLKAEPAIFIPGKFTERGKWMDGWESRRKREPGHDWCIIALGRPGSIRGVNVDTSHFNGNQPEFCTVEGAEVAEGASVVGVAGGAAGGNIPWTEVVARTPLNPSSEHYIAARPGVLGKRFTHLRLNIFPDGGVARFRVHGEVLLDWKAIAAKNEPVDLAAAENGGLVIACNDMHFGSRHNLIMPGRAVNMGEGWETRRKRGLKGGEHDWAIVQFGHRGTISKIEVDTNHFKGNFPESCLIAVCEAGSDGARAVGAFDPAAVRWTVLLPRTKLKADTRHFFEKELAAATGTWTIARLSIFPDGGVSRLRVWGRPVL